MCIERNPSVLIQIERIEDLLKRSGVRDFCLTCLKSTSGNRCCLHCNLVGPKGCIMKPLVCSLWLCEEAKAEFPQVAKELGEIAAQWPVMVAHGLPHASLRAENLTDSPDVVDPRFLVPHYDALRRRRDLGPEPSATTHPFARLRAESQPVRAGSNQ